jgi:hypothetical protein
MAERQTPTLEELQAEIIRRAGREALVAGYVGADMPRYNTLTARRVYTAFSRGVRLAMRDQRRIRYLDAVLYAFHSYGLPPFDSDAHRLKDNAGHAFGLLKKRDILITRIYRQNQQRRFEGCR